MTLPRKALAIVALPLAFQVLILGAIAVQKQEEEVHVAAEVRSKEVVSSAYRLRALLVDVETGVRGFALTGVAAFLEPFHSGVAQAPEELQRLEILSRGVPRRTTAAEVTRDARLVLAFQTETLRLLRSGERDEVVEQERRHAGKRLMDAFRATLRRFMDEQSQLDTERRAAVARAQRRSSMLLAAGFVLNVIVALAIASYFVGNIASRLTVVIENTSRLAAGRELRAPVSGDDEIALLDAQFHAMAEQLETGRAELEEANRNLESFSYSVSHDLRAPLRAISGYVQMLREDCGAALDARGTRYIDVIGSEARRLGTLIDDLLALSRLGRSSLSLATVDVEALAREVFAEVADGSAVELVFDGKLPAACGDRTMLRQALLNLITNAVKFSRAAERPVVELGATSQAGVNTYWVRDNGVGFDARYADKLFGVFQRLHRDDEFEGTGVGLAIVQRVVRRLGGDVRAESRLGEGATFYFTLPAA